MHYLKNLYCDNHKNKDVPKNSCRIKNPKTNAQLSKRKSTLYPSRA